MGNCANGTDHVVQVQIPAYPQHSSKVFHQSIGGFKLTSVTFLCFLKNVLLFVHLLTYYYCKRSVAVYTMMDHEVVLRFCKICD